MQVTLCILAEEDHRVPVPSDSLSTDGEDLLLTSVPFVFFGNQGARYNWRGNQLHPVVPGGSQRMMYQHQGNPEEVNMRLFSIKHLERQDKKKAWEIIEELRKLRGANVNWERVPRLQRDCFNASKELIKQCMRSVTMENQSNLRSAALWELAKNVDACHFDDGVVPRMQLFVKPDECLICRSNERGLQPSDVYSLCMVGEPSPRDGGDLFYTRRKGVGFKSLFSISYNPVMVSSPFSFKFDTLTLGFYGAITPEWIDPISMRSASGSLAVPESWHELIPKTKTFLYAPLKDEVKTKLSTLEGLHDIDLLPLAFMKQLHALDIMVLKQERVGDKMVEMGNTSFNMAELEDVSNEIQKHHAAVLPLPTKLQILSHECKKCKLKKKVPATQGSNGKDQEVEVYYRIHQFKIAGDINMRERICLAFRVYENLPRHGKVEEESVYNYSPVFDAVKLPFAVQADWELTLNKSQLLDLSVVNQFIISSIPALFVLSFMSDDTLRNLADFYIPKPDSSVDGLWRDLDTRITDLMRTHLHLRDEKGKLLPRRACLIRSTHLPKTLITPELLEKVSPGSGFIDLEETPNAGVLPLCPFKQVLECIKNLASSGELNMTRIKQFWLYLLEDVPSPEAEECLDLLKELPIFPVTDRPEGRRLVEDGQRIFSTLRAEASAIPQAKELSKLLLPMFDFNKFMERIYNQDKLKTLLRKLGVREAEEKDIKKMLHFSFKERHPILQVSKNVWSIWEFITRGLGYAKVTDFLDSDTEICVPCHKLNEDGGKNMSVELVSLEVPHLHRMILPTFLGRDLFDPPYPSLVNRRGQMLLWVQVPEHFSSWQEKLKWESTLSIEYRIDGLRNNLDQERLHAKLPEILADVVKEGASNLEVQALLEPMIDFYLEYHPELFFTIRRNKELSAKVLFDLQDKPDFIKTEDGKFLRCSPSFIRECIKLCANHEDTPTENVLWTLFQKDEEAAVPALQRLRGAVGDVMDKVTGYAAAVFMHILTINLWNNFVHKVEDGKSKYSYEELNHVMHLIVHWSLLTSATVSIYKHPFYIPPPCVSFKSDGLGLQPCEGLNVVSAPSDDIGRFLCCLYDKMVMDYELLKFTPNLAVQYCKRFGVWLFRGNKYCCYPLKSLIWSLDNNIIALFQKTKNSQSILDLKSELAHLNDRKGPCAKLVKFYKGLPELGSGIIQSFIDKLKERLGAWTAKNLPIMPMEVEMAYIAFIRTMDEYYSQSAKSPDSGRKPPFEAVPVVNFVGEVQELKCDKEDVSSPLIVIFTSIGDHLTQYWRVKYPSRCLHPQIAGLFQRHFPIFSEKFNLLTPREGFMEFTPVDNIVHFLYTLRFSHVEVIGIVQELYCSQRMDDELTRLRYWHALTSFRKLYIAETSKRVEERDNECVRLLKKMKVPVLGPTEEGLGYLLLDLSQEVHGRGFVYLGSLFGVDLELEKDNLMAVKHPECTAAAKHSSDDRLVEAMECVEKSLLWEFFFLELGARPPTDFLARLGPVTQDAINRMRTEYEKTLKSNGDHVNMKVFKTISSILGHSSTQPEAPAYEAPSHPIPQPLPSPGRLLPSFSGPPVQRSASEGSYASLPPPARPYLPHGGRSSPPVSSVFVPIPTHPGSSSVSDELEEGEVEEGMVEEGGSAGSPIPLTLPLHAMPFNPQQAVNYGKRAGSSLQGGEQAKRMKEENI